MSDIVPSLDRAVIALTGEDAVHFLQGILTQDVTKLAEQNIQFAALLSPQGKILHDMFLVADGERILIDTPAAHRELLLKRLNLYKLRAKVALAMSDVVVAYSHTDGLADPRHASLPRRVYGAAGEITSAEHRAHELALGVPNSAIDFAPDSTTALDAGYDLLHGVSFTKGCYVGQEVTARMHYKNIARKGFYILEQNGVPKKLALLKFEDAAKGSITLDDESYIPRLPEWLAPKLAQHHANQEHHP